MTNWWNRYLGRFFGTLRIYGDEVRGRSYTTFVRWSIAKFLDSENKENAFDVCLIFIPLAQMKNNYAACPRTGIGLNGIVTCSGPRSHPTI
jgi:hypothetical protein